MAEILDSYDLAKMWTSPDAGDALKFKWGTVVAVDPSGMLSVRIAGYDSKVSCLNWAGADVGAIVGVLCKGSSWFAIASNGGGGRIAGLIQGYGGAVGKTPAGWLPCDGSTYYCSDYPALYLSIGRAYTASTISVDRFTVPNLGGRVALGANASYAVGATGGAEKHVHGGTTAQNGTLGAAIGSVANNSGAIGFKAYNPPYGVAGFGNSTYTLSSGNAGSLSFNHFTAIAGATESADGRPPYIVVNYMISTGAGYDTTGNLVSAGIANGAVTMEKLSSELSHKVESFIYTTTKKDTGRTTDDGYIIWGQVFKGTITAAANTRVDINIAISEFRRLLNVGGYWQYGVDSFRSMSMNGAYVSSTNSVQYGAMVSAISVGNIAFSSFSALARSNHTYTLFLDYTDGAPR